VRPPSTSSAGSAVDDGDTAGATRSAVIAEEVRVNQAALLEETTRTLTLYGDAPLNVYWEMTTACDLVCKHCRAEAIPHRDPLELSTAEGKALMREVKAMGSMMIRTGGDPMKRPDLFELIGDAREFRLPPGVTPGPTPTLTRDAAREFRNLGVAALGISPDGPSPEARDTLRG